MTKWAELEDLLTEERTLLLKGCIDDLPRVAKEKVRLLEKMPPREVPHRVRELAQSNATLLDAAGRGIRSVIDRLETARGAHDTRTYDEKGRLFSLSGSVRRRGTRV